MSPGTEIQPATVSATAVSRPLTPPTLAVPEGVTVVFAVRKRTGRVAGAKYKADGTPYKRPGPPPEPLHERTIRSWWQRRDEIMGRVPRKPTRLEQRRLAEGGGGGEEEGGG
ncbi:hypothetical protein LY76DRAFT_600322 [Colletotrichum caudatum]|nr:hypothetical protein LY76DRAFT_600322 [Colletotrichum caudatum]